MLKARLDTRSWERTCLQEGLTSEWKGDGRLPFPFLVYVLPALEDPRAAVMS